MSVQTTYSKAPPIAYAGLLYDEGPHDIITMRNVEASLSIPFGTAVCFKTSSPTTDLDALLPHSTADIVAGIVVHSHDYARTFTTPGGTTVGENDGTGLKPNSILQVMRKGRIWVAVPASLTVAVADRMYVRAVANGAISNQLGSVENASDGSNMIDLTKIGQFITSASVAASGNFVVVEVDFTNKP